jgi:hypothetical protein
LAFGLVAAGGRSGVARSEVAGAGELSCCLGVCFWAAATPTLRSSAAAAEITTCVFMPGSSGCGGRRKTPLALSGSCAESSMRSAALAAQAEAQRCCAA